ncbi:MAG: 50S ribosomal protein L13 [Firmicutes bacterium]|nr:50S ribosomal protein L13 [Bacillota bacterium]
MEKNKTYMARPADIERNWYVVDAEDKVLGRLAAEIATILRGKHKSQFTPHIDTGDFVIVVNAEKIKLTGRKREQKTYYWHTGYPGGLRSQTAGDLLAKKPEEVIRKAVWGMMPKNNLGRNQMKKLKVYVGPEHPHMAQMPQPLEAQEAAK